MNMFASAKYISRLMISFAVVMNGPLAIAGSMPALSIKSGTIVPIRVATVIEATRLRQTMMPRIGS